MYNDKPISMIYARSLNNVIGVNGNLPWKCSKDLKIFKAMTHGCCVVMGRKTWESLPIKPLPNRDCIVITSQPDYQATGATVVASLEEALDKANVPIVIIGGESVYNEALKYTDTVYASVMTLIIGRNAVDTYAMAPTLGSEFGQDTQTHHGAVDKIDASGKAYVEPAFMFMQYSRRDAGCTRSQILPKVQPMNNHSLG